MEAHAAAATTRTTEEIDAIAQQARALLLHHQLSFWSFQSDNGRKQDDSCRYGTHVISLSYEFGKCTPDEEIQDTLLHEIAHALADKTHNHDDVWRAKAIEIGCSGRRCHDVQFTLPRYII